MAPKSRTKLDYAAFQKLKKIAPNQLEARRAEQVDNWRARELPEELAFKLTNRCNLRCTHCYQWNEQGYHHALSAKEKRGELDLAIVDKVLRATQRVKSNVFIWGGEPLAYGAWDGLIDILDRADRWTSICTNGMLIEKRLQSLLRISKRLEMYIALDGFEAEHDALRGRGSFGKTLEGIRLLLEARTAGRYEGEITVNCVIQDSMVGRLFDFVRFLESEGVDAVYLSFPWHISNETSLMMDDYFQDHLSWIELATETSKASWHSYTFALDPENVEKLSSELARVDNESWRTKVRYNPALKPAEMRDFFLGSHRPAQKKTRCLALKSRMDVYPNGDVVSCHLFPEFVVGNLSTASVAEVWHGDQFDGMRKTIDKCGLMPICAKCNLLYSRGT
jgi:radical SAM protein with 4Fe4S-binding SPASM domain